MTNERLKNLIVELQRKNSEGHDYALSEIDAVASRILEAIDYYTNSGATPIVKIVSEFNFKTYKAKMTSKLSGNIYVNNKEKTEKYKSPRVILVNKAEGLFHQRFVIAHELAHFLFDYLGHESEYETGFSNTYCKNKHESNEEKRTNRFAAELLMPKKLFIKQYEIAKNTENDELFVVKYLSEFFETTPESIKKRIEEVFA